MVNHLINLLSNCDNRVLAQASTGKQGVLGPTKIYLAVQPSGSDGGGSTDNSQPPPLAPVQQQTTQSSQSQSSPVVQTSSTIQANATVISGTSTAQQVCNMIPMQPKPKVIVQPVNQVLYT